jgi:DNA-binding NarL/FixJ family response regulator
VAGNSTSAAQVLSPRLGAHDRDLRPPGAGLVGRRDRPTGDRAPAPERDREGLQAALDAAAEFDALPLLADVEAPALVLHRREISWLPVSIARDLAARLRDARLTILEGESTAPYLADAEAIAQAIDEFLGEPDRPAAPVEASAAMVPRPFPALAGHTPSERVPTQPVRDLTAREVEVVRLLASGQTNQEIAEELVVSVRTVERHIANIYHKLGARGRAHATAYALSRGLI